MYVRIEVTQNFSKLARMTEISHFLQVNNKYVQETPNCGFLKPNLFRTSRKPRKFHKNLGLHRKPDFIINLESYRLLVLVTLKSSVHFLVSIMLTLNMNLVAIEYTYDYTINTSSLHSFFISTASFIMS